MWYGTDELLQISREQSTVKKALYWISTRLHENPSKHLEFNNPSQDSYASRNSLFSSVIILPQGGLYGQIRMLVLQLLALEDLCHGLEDMERKKGLHDK